MHVPMKGIILLTAITLISSIPLIYGLLFSFIHLTESRFRQRADQMNSDAVSNASYSRMAFSAFLSFIMVLPVIYLTDPVSTEGWLRSIYAAFLLAVMAPFIFLFASWLWKRKSQIIILFLVSVLFLITRSRRIASASSLELFYLFFTILLVWLGMGNCLSCGEFTVWNNIAGYYLPQVC